jgi:hypothetical protein
MSERETTQQPIERRAFLGRLAAIALVGGGMPGPWLRDRASSPRHHPAPRAGVTAARVIADDELPADDAESRRAYAAAREAPALFDGVACVCSCPETMRHRSLLECFETRHPTACPGCLDEAALVGRLAADGRGLDAVRDAVDQAFGR